MKVEMLLLAMSVFVVIMKVLGMMNFMILGIYLFVVFAVTVENFLKCRNKLYFELKEKRNDLVKKYFHWGMFPSWEQSVFLAEDKERDEFVEKARRNVLYVNLFVLLGIVNLVVTCFLLMILF